jgi:hypothetical protein
VILTYYLSFLKICIMSLQNMLYIYVASLSMELNARPSSFGRKLNYSINNLLEMHNVLPDHRLI